MMFHRSLAMLLLLFSASLLLVTNNIISASTCSYYDRLVDIKFRSLDSGFSESFFRDGDYRNHAALMTTPIRVRTNSTLPTIIIEGLTPKRRIISSSISGTTSTPRWNQHQQQQVTMIANMNYSVELTMMNINNNQQPPLTFIAPINVVTTIPNNNNNNKDNHGGQAVFDSVVVSRDGLWNTTFRLRQNGVAVVSSNNALPLLLRGPYLAVGDNDTAVQNFDCRLFHYSNSDDPILKNVNLVNQLPIVAPSRLKLIPSNPNLWKYTDLTSSSAATSSSSSSSSIVTSYSQLLPSSDNLISSRVVPFENATLAITQGQPLPTFRIAILSTHSLSPWSCFVNFSDSPNSVFVSTFTTTVPLGGLVMRATAYGSRLGTFSEEIIASVPVVDSTKFAQNNINNLGFELNNGEVVFDGSIVLQNFVGLVEIQFTLFDTIRGETVRHVPSLSIFAVVSKVTRPAAGLVFVRRGSLSSLWHDKRNDETSFALKYRKAGGFNQLKFGFDNELDDCVSFRAGVPLPSISVHAVTSSGRADDVSSGIVVKAFCESASLKNNIANIVNGMATFSHLEIVDNSFNENRLHVIKFVLIMRLRDSAGLLQQDQYHHQGSSSSSLAVGELNATTALFTRPFKIFSAVSTTSSSSSPFSHQNIRRFSFDKRNRAMPFEFASLAVQVNTALPPIRLVITDALGEIIRDPYAVQREENLIVTATLIPLRSDVNTSTLFSSSTSSTANNNNNQAGMTVIANQSFSTSLNSNATFFSSYSSSSFYYILRQVVNNGFRIRFTLYDTSRTSAPKHPLHGASVSTGPISVLANNNPLPFSTASFSPLISTSSINQETLISATESSGTAQTPAQVVVDGDTMPVITIDLLNSKGEIARGNSYTGLQAVVSGGKCRIQNGVSYAFRGQVVFRNLRIYDCYGSTITSTSSIDGYQSEDSTVIVLRFIHKVQSNAADQSLVAAYSFLDMVAGQIMVLPPRIQQSVVQTKYFRYALIQSSSSTNPFTDPNNPSSSSSAAAAAASSAAGGGTSGTNSTGGRETAAANILVTTDWTKVPSHLQIASSNALSSTFWTTYRAYGMISASRSAVLPSTAIQVGCAAAVSSSSSSGGTANNNNIDELVGLDDLIQTYLTTTPPETLDRLRKSKQRQLMSTLTSNYQNLLSSLQRGKVSSVSSFSPASLYAPSCSIQGNWITTKSLLRDDDDSTSTTATTNSASSSYSSGTFYQFITRDTTNVTFDDLVLRFDGAIQRTMTVRFCSKTALIPCINIPIELVVDNGLASNAGADDDITLSILSQPSPSQIQSSVNSLENTSVGWGLFSSSDQFTPFPRDDSVSVHTSLSTASVSSSSSSTTTTSSSNNIASLTSSTDNFLGTGRTGLMEVRLDPRRDLLKDSLVSMKFYVESSLSSNHQNNNNDEFYSPSTAFTLPFTVEPDSPSDFLDPSLKHIVAILDIPYPRFHTENWKRLVSEHFQISPSRIIIERVGWSWRTGGDNGPQGSRTTAGSGSNLRVGTRVEFHLDLASTTTDVKLPISITEKQMMTFRDSCGSNNNNVKVDLHIAAIFDGDKRQYPAGTYGATVKQQEQQAAAVASLSFSAQDNFCDRRYFEDRIESARHCEAYRDAATITPQGTQTGKSNRCPCFESIFSENIAGKCLDEDVTILLCDYLRDCNSYTVIEGLCDSILPSRAARVAIVFFSTAGVIAIVALYEKYKTKSLRNFKKVKVRSEEEDVNQDYSNVESTFV